MVYERFMNNGLVEMPVVGAVGPWALGVQTNCFVG